MKKKILLCFSAGGHFTQMQQLISCLPSNSFKMISEDAPDVIEFKNKNKIETLILPKIISNRFLFLLKNITYLFQIIRTVKSCDLMISTGGITSVIPGLMCFICRKKILFVETIAKQNELTITGKLFYLIANKFYVQSRHLAEMYRKAEFVGTLYKL